jgi:hypothetical protein
MPLLVCLQHDDGEFTDLVPVVFFREAAHRAVGRGGGFNSFEETSEHLCGWLARPGDMTDALSIPIRDLTGDDDDDGVFGDLEMDAGLVAVLRAMGVDPRAFGVLCALSPQGIMTIDGIRFTMDGGMNMSSRIWNAAATIDLDEVTDLNTHAGRMETGQHLPETILSTLGGRRVGEIIDHPLLRGCGLVIEEAHAIGLGTRIILQDGRPARMRDLGPTAAERRRSVA